MMNKQQLQAAMEGSEFSSEARMILAPEGAVSGFGTTVGNGVEGWAPGATFVHTDGATPGALAYINVGTKTTAVWVPISDPRLHFEIGRSSTRFWDDFCPQLCQYTDTNDTGTGAAAISTYAYGSRTLATAAADNDYHYYTTVGPVVDLNLSITTFQWEARIRLVEADTDKANWWCGLIIASDVDADIVGDNGAGPKANYDGCLFWKVDGGTDINFEVSRAATQSTTEVMGTWASNTWVRLGIVFDGAQVTPFLNGTAGTAVTVANPPASYLSGFGVKAGSGSAETIECDYHGAYMLVTSGSR